MYKLLYIVTPGDFWKGNILGIKEKSIFEDNVVRQSKKPFKIQFVRLKCSVY